MLTAADIFTAVVVFLYGSIAGSFLNVCIYRLPAGEDIVSVRSHCMSCGKPVAWYDLVPVVSFLLLKGRCRYCKAKLSIQYPLVELINGIGWILVFFRNGKPDFAAEGFFVQSILLCLMTSVLIVISVIDFRTFEILPVCNGFLLLLGIIAAVWDREHFLEHGIGFLCVSGFLYLLYFLTKGQGIGGGDIKLMAAAGLLLGWKQIILAFFLGCILGSVIHLIRMKISGADRVLAMGPYLSIGIFIAALYGNSMVQFYLNKILT